jgi:hypothetical protein
LNWSVLFSKHRFSHTPSPIPSVDWNTGIRTVGHIDAAAGRVLYLAGSTEDASEQFMALSAGLPIRAPSPIAALQTRFQDQLLTLQGPVDELSFVYCFSKTFQGSQQYIAGRATFTSVDVNTKEKKAFFGSHIPVFGPNYYSGIGKANSASRRPDPAPAPIL